MNRLGCSLCDHNLDFNFLCMTLSSRLTTIFQNCLPGHVSNLHRYSILGPFLDTQLILTLPETARDGLSKPTTSLPSYLSLEGLPCPLTVDIHNPTVLPSTSGHTPNFRTSLRNSALYTSFQGLSKVSPYRSFHSFARIIEIMVPTIDDMHAFCKERRPHLFVRVMWNLFSG